MIDETGELMRLAERYDVYDLCRIVLHDERFPIWSGSGNSTRHHYGKGQLAVHTLQVVELCLKNNDYFSVKMQCEARQLFLAALFHDAGKMWDYRPTTADYAQWENAPHKYEIYHLSRSALVWNSACENALDEYKNQWLTQDYCDQVLHAILSHHGRREWGSAVEPRTRLAWMLHLCDSISARIDDCDKVYER